MRLIADIRRRGCIRETDVAALARSFRNNGGLSEFDVDLLFDLHAHCAIKDQSWSGFFQAAVSDHIVRDVEPAGYLTLAQSQWLQSRLTGDTDVVATKIELDLLRAIIERARWVPGSLVAFALAQILHAVDTGHGALRAGQVFEVGRITPAEIGFVREVLVGYGAESGLGMTLPEVEMMLAINDALDGECHEPEWTDLMIRVLVDGLMSASGQTSPERRGVLSTGLPIALERLDPLDGGSVLPASLAELMRGYQPVGREENVLERLERQRIEIITGESVLMPDAAWFAGRMDRPMPPSAIETAVLTAFDVAGPVLPRDRAASRTTCAA